MKKITVICTILNEVNTIQGLLDALAKQTLKPAKIIIADGGSTDGSQRLIKNWQKKHSSVNLSLINTPGNRSVGRNAAIQQANTTYIAITDAGCAPQPEWLAELVADQHQSKASVVAGYYRGIAQTNFEQAVIPYALVMPDKVNPANFLPATRSMLIDKAVWRKLGGFNENLSDNEDYDFARRLQTQQIPIAFTDQAIVDWQPRSNLYDFANMIFRFARGDAQARLFRAKVLLIFTRYLIAIGILSVIFIFTGWKDLVAAVLLFFTVYSLWAIHKNVRYVPQGWYWLPILQYVADIAVMWGTVVGLFSLKK